jgi:hypothetical protein
MRKPWTISKHQKGLSAAVRNSRANFEIYQGHPAQSRPAVRVEYPRLGEVIVPPSYTLRISTASRPTDAVEVSIDHGAWLPCREGLGLWWYDWSGFSEGEHELTARVRTADGICAASAPCRFSVKDARWG